MIELQDLSSSSSYIDTFNDTNTLYEELKSNMIQLKFEQQKRIIPKFDEEENEQLDKKIRELVLSMTPKVKQCEYNIKCLSNASLKSKEDTAIQENIINYLAVKLRDFTRELRNNEEIYMASYKDLVGERNVEKLDDDDNENSKMSANFFQINDDDTNSILKKRDAEINILLSSITQLSTIFKDLQSLVQHQGTILDRIDFNIEAALDNTVDAHKHLVNGNKEMKKSCFRNAMLIILIVIFVESILLLFKFIDEA